MIQDFRRSPLRDFERSALRERNKRPEYGQLCLFFFSDNFQFQDDGQPNPISRAAVTRATEILAGLRFPGDQVAHAYTFHDDLNLLTFFGPRPYEASAVLSTNRSYNPISGRHSVEVFLARLQLPSDLRSCAVITGTLEEPAPFLFSRITFASATDGVDIRGSFPPTVAVPFLGGFVEPPAYTADRQYLLFRGLGCRRFTRITNSGVVTAYPNCNLV